ncbi:Bcr/CflA family multidrug efflux MFS transporter [Parapusillimonas granuli]|nr:Bcr/CflA family multidrug efflux MFS transporter [Parapusillimonas granuli]MBB5213567.1 DHA1 family bicyclomycin/chloramphenicol resistance-like MFS transporter [Parapusillimonas granuli]
MQSPPSHLTSIPPWLVLMGLLTALGPLAIDMYLPAFPDMVRSLGTDQGMVERTLPSYLLGLAAAQVFYGPFADRYGRKKPLLFGLIVFTIASVGCALTDSIEHLSLWRIAQAFGGAAGMVIPRAVIRDNFDTRDASKALSVLMLVMGVTPILAPILGAQVLNFGSWRYIFAIMAGCGALLFVSVVFGMRETLVPEKTIPLSFGNIGRNYRGLLAHKRFMCYSLAGGFGSAGMFAYISGSPRVFINVFDVPPQYFGLLFGLNAAALIATSQVSARLLNRHAPETLLKFAQAALLIGSAAGFAMTLAGVLTLPLLMAALLCFMAGQGFVNPNAAALALREQGHRLGVSSAMMGTLQMICGSAAGLGVSAWQSDTALPLTGILAFCAFLSWLFGRIALRAPATARDHRGAGRS